MGRLKKSSIAMAQPQNQTRQTQTYDLAIAGAGFAGLGLALACRQVLGPAFRILVVDPAPGSALPHQGRASAIAADGRRFLSALGVWGRVEAQAQPIVKMVVTDSDLAAPLRPSFLTFDEADAPGEPLAHMIEHDVLIEAMFAEARSSGLTIAAAKVEMFRAGAQGIDMELTSGRAVRARLLVAADGARSRLRELAGIPTSGWSYGQSAIVTSVHHERPHDGIAYEHFLPSGPFAILPLTGRRSSIVWTEASQRAERIMKSDDLLFHHELETRFGHQLGSIEAKGKRLVLPLQIRIARRFADRRLALMGDAAHVIHPLAGQGLNLGLRDAAALTDCIVDHARLGLDIGDPALLERYQRWRRFDTVAMGLMTEGLNRLFSNASAPLRLVRDVGLGLVERLPLAKTFFMQGAAGCQKDGPRLMRRA